MRRNHVSHDANERRRGVTTAQQAQSSITTCLFIPFHAFRVVGTSTLADNSSKVKISRSNFLLLSNTWQVSSRELKSHPASHHCSNACQVNSSMEGVVKGMGSALKTMDVERISKTMDNFEQQFEDMDVRAGYMENAMSNSTAMSTPQEQVDGLIQMVADEAGLELGEQLDDAGPVSSKIPAKPEAAPAPAAADGEDELANRLAALRK